MIRRMFVNEMEARETALYCVERFNRIARMCGDKESVDAVSLSITAHMIKLSEALLYIYCCKFQSPDGLLEFPTLRDISRRRGGMAVPEDVSRAARIMIRTERDIEINLMPDTFLIKEFLEEVKVFVSWLSEEMDDFKVPVLEEISGVINKLS